jgi:hypothetical protein
LKVCPWLAAFDGCSIPSSHATQIGSRISPKILTRILALFSKNPCPMKMLHENAMSPYIPVYARVCHCALRSRPPERAGVLVVSAAQELQPERPRDAVPSYKLEICSFRGNRRKRGMCSCEVLSFDLGDLERTLKKNVTRETRQSIPVKKMRYSL